MELTRRNFLATSAALTVAGAAEAKDERTGMPMRTLGKTVKRYLSLRSVQAAAGWRTKKKTRLWTQ